MMIPPLAGKRIVNTRARHQAGELDDLLKMRGAEPVSYPCIAIAPPEEHSVLDSALTGAVDGLHNWLVLTSSNTVLAIHQRLEALAIDPSHLRHLKIAAVGASTAQFVGDVLGLHVSLIPDEFVAESLGESLTRKASGRILLPQSARARDTLSTYLINAGLDVTTIDAYTIISGSGGENVPEMLVAGQIDAVVFTSSSTVEYFFMRIAAEGGNTKLLTNTCIACIGPITAKTLTMFGYQAHVVPEDHTLIGLVSELEDWFSEVTVT